MNLQDAYEAQRRYFAAYGEEQAQAMTKEHGGGASCMYRAEIDGEIRRCAVGCLIPDALYSPELERNTVDGLFNGQQNTSNPAAAERVIKLLGITEDNLDAWVQLQRAHDEAIETTGNGIVKRLDEAAALLGLTTPGTLAIKARELRDEADEADRELFTRFGRDELDESSPYSL